MKFGAVGWVGTRRSWKSDPGSGHERLHMPDKEREPYSLWCAAVKIF